MDSGQAFWCTGRNALYRLTPDMRLTRRIEDGADGVTNAEKMLAEVEALVT